VVAAGPAAFRESRTGRSSEPESRPQGDFAGRFGVGVSRIVAEVDADGAAAELMAQPGFDRRQPGVVPVRRRPGNREARAVPTP